MTDRLRIIAAKFLLKVSSAYPTIAFLFSLPMMAILGVEVMAVYQDLLLADIRRHIFRNKIRYPDNKFLFPYDGKFDSDAAKPRPQA